MSQTPIERTGPLGYGCMRLAEDEARSRLALRSAWDAGIRLFDHADIYGAGRCEEIFGQALREHPGMRDAMVLQTKVGIRGDPARYDFSTEYLSTALEGSLRRLGVDHVDVLLLHRIDLLMDTRAVGAWLDATRSSGKATQVGLSNASPSQFRALQAHCESKLAAHQIEINLDDVSAFTDGRLDLCQELGVQPQAWCPLAGLAYPAWGQNASAERWLTIKAELQRQADERSTGIANVVIDWLRRHPSGIVPLIGTTSPDRISALAAPPDRTAEDGHADWYRLYEARRGAPMP